MRKRNPNARCGTCPIWHQNPQSTCGKCRLNPDAVEKMDTEWCGQHPDFWEAEAEAEPDCEPTQEALEEIVRLRARVAAYESEIGAHNSVMDSLPKHDRPTDCAHGLHILADWFDSLYGDAGTGRDQVQQDLRKWADEIERLLARVAELEAEVEVEEYKICSNCKYEELQSTQEPCDTCVGEEYPGWEPKERNET